MADNGYSSTKKLPCPAADKENVDSSPVEIQSDAAPQRPCRRTPLQEHTNAEVDVDSESKNRNITGKIRSFNFQSKTLKWLRSKDDISLGGTYHIYTFLSSLIRLSLRHLNYYYLRFADVYFKSHT